MVPCAAQASFLKPWVLMLKSEKQSTPYCEVTTAPTWYGVVLSPTLSLDTLCMASQVLARLLPDSSTHSSIVNRAGRLRQGCCLLFFSCSAVQAGCCARARGILIRRLVGLVVL